MRSVLCDQLFSHRHIGGVQGVSGRSRFTLQADFFYIITYKIKYDMIYLFNFLMTCMLKTNKMKNVSDWSLISSKKKVSNMLNVLKIYWSTPAAYHWSPRSSIHAKNWNKVRYGKLTTQYIQLYEFNNVKRSAVLIIVGRM